MRPDRLFVDVVFPTLDVPVPLREDQLVASLLHYDTLIPELVIAVPKISSPSRCSRTVLSEPQTAEQLVEATTLVSLVEVIEQPVDIPVGVFLAVEFSKVFSPDRVLL